MQLDGPASSRKPDASHPSSRELCRDFWLSVEQMPEQLSTAPNVVRAKRWARAILVPYAIIPTLFFAIMIFFRPHRANE